VRTFLSRFAALIQFVLSGFDRLRFRGEAPLLCNDRGVNSYLYRNAIRYVDFIDHCKQLTDTLTQQTLQQAKDQGVPLVHLNSPALDKEAIALEHAARQRRALPGGRIALVTAVESCLTYRLRTDADGRAYPRKQEGKCQHYYHYFQHPELGLCYVRIQTHFPFIVRVGMNGRQWLYQQLRRRGVAFEHQGNLLVKVADVKLAQRLLSDQVFANYARLLNELVAPVHPLWSYLQSHAPYYWVGEQSEWADDFLFRSPADLAAWYPRWLRHGMDTLRCTDVLRYLGKQRPTLCAGEAKIDLRHRVEGARVKFWYQSNSLKLYDKEGVTLRVETTINQPRQFRVFARNLRAPKTEAPKWRTMRKGVADFERRAEVSRAANGRLLESLATVTEPTTLGELVKPLGQPVLKPGRRRVRALNPLTGRDGELLRLLARGDFLINGFRNADLRLALWGAAPDAAQERRRSAAMTRLLTLLRAHAVIVKVPRSQRYRLSAAGRRLVTALSAAHHCDTARLVA